MAHYHTDDGIRHDIKPNDEKVIVAEVPEIDPEVEDEAPLEDVSEPELDDEIEPEAKEEV